DPSELTGRGQWRRVPVTLAPGMWIKALAVDATGSLWLGGPGGLVKLAIDGRQTLYTAAEGLGVNGVSALSEDRDGNLWIGTAFQGIYKLAGETIVSFSTADGLADGPVRKVLASQDGRMYVSTQRNGFFEIVGRRVVPVEGSQAKPFNITGSRILQDHRGDWWIGTNQGLYRFEGPDLQVRHGQRITTAEGLSNQNIEMIGEGRGGGIWVSAYDRAAIESNPVVNPHLYRYDAGRRGSVLFERVPLRAAWAPDLVSRMIAERSGAVWLGGFRTLDRASRDQTLGFEPTEGLPETEPRAFFQDSRGWLWIGLRNKGVSVTRDPTATQPQF